MVKLVVSIPTVLKLPVLAVVASAVLTGSIRSKACKDQKDIVA